jgi:type IV secretion system protein VirB6/type IV secretion system protein TrbL
MIAANLIMEYCSAFILIYAGVFILGFGAATWTRDMVITYFKTVISCGLRIMTMILIIGIGLDIINGFTLSNNPTIKECAALLISALILYVLSNRVPQTVGALAGGASMDSGGGSALVGAAAGMAGAGMMMKEAAGTVANEVGGGFSAVKAAAGKARETISGSGSMSSGGSSGGAGGRMGSVLSTGGSYAKEIFKNLKQGRADVKAQQKAARVSQTFGGKVAKSINEKE